MTSEKTTRFRPPTDRPGGAVLPETINRRLAELQDRVARARAIVQLAADRAAQIEDHGEALPEIVDVRLSLEAAVLLLEEVGPNLDQVVLLAPTPPEEIAAALEEDGTREVRQLRLAPSPAEEVQP